MPWACIRLWPGKRWRKPLIIGGVVLVLAFLMFGRGKPLEVETAVAEPPSAAGAVLNASGYVTARRIATVASRTTGQLVEVTFEEGAVAYDHRDAQGFIRLNALRLRTLGMRKRKMGV